MQLLADVLSNYRATYQELSGLAKNIGTVDQQSLLVGLPKFFVNLLTEQNRNDEFKIEGSIGSGNLPLVPWVAIFNRKVTTTAQEGYYIVLLFSEDMQSCFLSLNQGVTKIKNEYGQALANAKMRSASELALQFIVADPFAISGVIDLAASSHLGKGYEQGAIESYKYDSLTLPNEFKLAEDFFQLLGHYDQLVDLAGPSLQTHVPVSESEFQQVAMERASSINQDAIEPLVPVPAPKKLTNSSGGYKRNVKYAALALKRAGFKCEIDQAHESFVSRTKYRQYVEAHHLVPLSKQSAFQSSLDVPANIVALCVTCHKLLHHGRTIDKQAHLLKLLDERLSKLEKMEIGLNGQALLSFYNRDLPENE